MSPHFAHQREPAAVHATAAALPNHGGTAAGRVGVAVPLSWLATAFGCLASAGCAELRRSAYFPETLTVTSSFSHDEHGGWDRENVGANLTWRLKPLPVAPVPPDPQEYPHP